MGETHHFRPRLGNLPLFQALQHGFFSVEDVGRSGEGGALAATEI